MKIAYLAPEIPALSATFVYNEILALQALGTEVVAFSVHRPASTVNDIKVARLKAGVVHIYDYAVISVLLAHISLLFKSPLRYMRSLYALFKDMGTLGLLSRGAFGQAYRYFYAAKLACDLADKQCQHLHVHFAHTPTDIAMYASLLSGIPFSVTAHANDIFERGYLLKEKVERASFFATISEFNKRFLAKNNIAVDSICIVRCGVDSESFSLRESFESGDKIKLGVVGRLVEKKGIDTLIKAVSLMKQQGLAVELNIAGSGPLEAELKECVLSCSLTMSDVHFLGALDHTEVAGFITSLDAFVLPCQKDSNGDMDGIPVVLMEAMLSGVPVISTEISGIPELIINKETGLLVMPGDEKELAIAISNLIDDDDLKNSMIINAAVKVKEEFSLKSNAGKLNGMFNQVINGTKII